MISESHCADQKVVRLVSWSCLVECLVRVQGEYSYGSGAPRRVWNFSELGGGAPSVGLRPSRDVLGRTRSPQYGLFLSGLLRVANANLLPSYSPILLSLSLRAIDHAPTPNPRRFRPLWCAPTHTGASAALSHENDDDDDDEVPSNAERRA